MYSPFEARVEDVNPAGDVARSMSCLECSTTRILLAWTILEFVFPTFFCSVLYHKYEWANTRILEVHVNS